MELSGNAAIITGGGSGLGRETARTLAAQGVKVSVIDISAEAVAAVAAEIGGLGIVCDVSDANALAAAIAEAKAAHGVARIAVACAGICPAARVVGREGPMPLDDFAKVIAVNLIGSFNLIRLAAADMTQAEVVDADQQRGVIITTASVAATDGQIGQAAYSASKGGVVGMTLPIARELARFGVRIMSISPGIMATPLLTNMPQNVQDSLNASVPFPARMGDPKEYARLVCHIVENDYLNGSEIRLDGAIRMKEK